MKEYNASERGKEVQRIFNQSEKGKQLRKKHEHSEKRKKWRAEYNKTPKRKEYFKSYKRSERGKESDKKYRQTESRKICMRRYYKSEKGKAKIREHTRARRQTDINFRLIDILRHRVYMGLKKGYKAGSGVRDLGCTIEELKKYLESKFQPGMTWENYGKYGWHIDHIIPISSFDLSNREQLLKACHYTNLQPLWAHDNIVKGTKIFNSQPSESDHLEVSLPE